ncbi:ABC transporter permease [Streptomyces litchfieldiae]|uniref:ABC transporter permease n=1 Tax=Streptomyces litchfieldiae TaxID=3075543 RepID=A0ABU2MMR8_9ACTN|nr:ABC transporter permease [Streptomyces sp. DSM 44938]MDT0342419.1 ABC transporter permease [Streptomyces sp. DSM 44938]
MAVTQSVLARTGVRAGDTLPVVLEDGRTRPLRVVAVLTDDSAPGEVLLPYGTVREHDPVALAEVVYRTGPQPADLPAELGAREVGVAEYAARGDAEEDRLVWVFTLLLTGMSAGCTGLAVGNTLLMATAARSGDFAVLRRSGATPGQVLRMVAGETAFVVALGTLLG